MTEQGLNKFFIDLILAHNSKSLLAISSKDLTSLAGSCKEHLDSLAISPSIKKIAVNPVDLCVVFEDVEIKKTQLGLIKNTLAQKILVLRDNASDQDHQLLLELGFTPDPQINNLNAYSYNLMTYNNKRGWNNSEGWANPENFEKFRW